MSFGHSQELINDYEKLFEIEEAYKLILRTGSQYFRTAFSNE